QHFQKHRHHAREHVYGDAERPAPPLERREPATQPDDEGGERRPDQGARHVESKRRQKRQGLPTEARVDGHLSGEEQAPPRPNGEDHPQRRVRRTPPMTGCRGSGGGERHRVNNTTAARRAAIARSDCDETRSGCDELRLRRDESLPLAVYASDVLHKLRKGGVEVRMMPSGPVNARTTSNSIPALTPSR